MKDIQVITGCMFAGKTTELLNRLKATNKQYLLVKPRVDTRDQLNNISTHDGVFEKGIRVNKLSEIFTQIKDIKVVGIDEAQFFSKSIIVDIEYLASKQITIIVAGLDKDYLNRSFGYMKEISSIASSTTVLTARCNHCGRPASYSHRKNHLNNTQVLIGNSSEYEALCSTCYFK
ncbi:MAG: thymidine kinase [Flavobacteriales bacterium]|jgi:thymidine kinase|nr:thymidine kinase [Flavobacteriales bacterium]|tara:strand:+ start:187 stop:711 length:525 start_codon:yes stop_codon:yes gene_type:complete